MGNTLTNCYEKKRSIEEEPIEEEVKERKKKKKKYKNIKQIIENTKNLSQNLETKNMQKNEKSLSINLQTGVNLDKKPNLDDHILTTESSTNENKKSKIFKERRKDNVNEIEESDCYTSLETQKSKNYNKLNINNLFFIYEEGHRQKYKLPKSFKDEHNEIISNELEKYFQKENRKMGIGKRDVYSENIIIGIVEYLESDSNDNEVKLKRKEAIDLKQRKQFFIISSTNILEFIFDIKSSKISLQKKINFLSIELISITNDHSKVLLHSNSKIEKKSVMVISSDDKELNLNLALCICNLSFQNFSVIKKIAIIPNNLQLIKKIMNDFTFESFCISFENYINQLFNLVSELIPLDYNETFLKAIPLSKIQLKFTEMKKYRVLIITNKRIIEIESKEDCSNDKDNKNDYMFNIIPISQIKGLVLIKKNFRMELDIENSESNIVYFSVLVNDLLILIRELHSKECLNELKLYRK